MTSEHLKVSIVLLMTSEILISQYGIMYEI